jgi:3D (Asp-Asp-Asp) domain-containing protein
MSRIPKNYTRRTHRWIAVSRDLLSIYSLGDSVIVSGIPNEEDKVYVIKDKMAARHRNMIDLLVKPNGLKGVFKQVKIRKYER